METFLSTMEIRQLIRTRQQGDAEALGALYQTYAQRMRGVCRRYICDEQAVDDVLHDAFRHHLHLVRPAARPTKSRGLDAGHREEYGIKIQSPSRHLSSVPIGRSRWQSDISAEAARRQGLPLEDVMQMIDRLPEGYGRVFRLSVFEGMSHKEIASCWASSSTPRRRSWRAKKMLRAMMKRYWVVLLLLLIPTAMLLLKKEKQIEKPTVVEQTKRKEPAKQDKVKPAQTPTIEPTSTGKQYVPAVLTLTPDPDSRDARVATTCRHAATHHSQWMSQQTAQAIVRTTNSL